MNASESTGAEAGALEVHGGEVDAASERYGAPRDRWMDLSTGVNPQAYPLPELALDYWRRLPDSGLDAWLRDAAAGAWGVADPEWVAAGPGSQAFIQLLPRLFPTGDVAVVGPTYQEHAKCWTDAGHRVIEIDRPEDAPSSATVLVVVNPNNPCGRIAEPARLLAAGRDRLLIVDEAFCDLAPESSLARHVGGPSLVVLRSFGKFYGLAGLRLGFALAGRPLIDRLRRAMGPWAVSGPAAAIGAVALSDDAWARATRRRLMGAAGRLDGLLIRSGLDVIGGVALFRLVECARASELFEHLARAAILVRRFHGHPHWLRFGLPADDEAFDRLAATLVTWRSQSGPSLGRGRVRAVAAASDEGRGIGQSDR